MQSLHQTGVDSGIGSRAFRTAAQNHGVGGFQAQRAGVGGDVGPALVNNADDAQGHADALDPHAIRPRPFREARADGIVEPRDLLEPASHGLDPLFHRGAADRAAPPAVAARGSFAHVPSLAARSRPRHARSAAAAASSARFFCALGPNASTLGSRPRGSADAAMSPHRRITKSADCAAPASCGLHS